MLLGIKLGALLAAAAVYLIIWALGYSSGLTGKLHSRLQPSKLTTEGWVVAYCGTFGLALIIAIILGLLQSSVYGFKRVLVGLMIGVVVTAVKAGDYFCEGRSLQQYLTSIVPSFLALVVMGLILAGWG